MILFCVNTEVWQTPRLCQIPVLCSCWFFGGKWGSCLALSGMKEQDETCRDDGWADGKAEEQTSGGKTLIRSQKDGFKCDQMKRYNMSDCRSLCSFSVTIHLWCMCRCASMCVSVYVYVNVLTQMRTKINKRWMEGCWVLVPTEFNQLKDTVNFLSVFLLYFQHMMDDMACNLNHNIYGPNVDIQYFS